MVNTNGIVSIELEGVKHTLLFGMKAIRIFSEKTSQEIQRQNATIEDVNEWNFQIEENKSFIYLVYAGLCNYAESNDLEYPSYQDCYLIANELLFDANQQVKIWEVFKSSKAGSNLLSAFAQKQESKKKNTKKQTGTK